MIEMWFPISDIPAEGREYTFDDQTLWREAWKKFSIDLTPVNDLIAVVSIMPQSDDGALIRGTLKGAVSMPCDRCTAEYVLEIDESFDAFEQLPESDEELDEEPRIRVDNSQLQLNMGGILWEEFAVALPIKPLCSGDCKGICPNCGADLNKSTCECDQNEGDERLAVFRNLKIK